jgi:hypothetical protein
MTRKAGLPKVNNTLQNPPYKTLQTIAALYSDVLDQIKPEMVDPFYLKEFLLSIFDAYFIGELNKKSLINSLCKITNLDGLQIVEFMGSINAYKKQYNWEYGPSELIVRYFLKVPKMKNVLNIAAKKVKKIV